MALKDRLHKGRARLAGVNWYLCSGIGFLLLVLAAFGLAAWKLGLVLNDAEALPIEAVAIKGERQYTTDAEIRGALQDLMQRSFFSADVAEVQQALEALPWVYRASVRREWPAKLKVYLQEQVAVAHWNQDEWLNEHGEVFLAPPQPGLENLPWLAGPEPMAKEVLISFRQMDELLRINSFKLDRLSLSRDMPGRRLWATASCWSWDERTRWRGYSVLSTCIPSWLNRKRVSPEWIYAMTRVWQ